MLSPRAFNIYSSWLSSLEKRSSPFPLIRRLELNLPQRISEGITKKQTITDLKSQIAEIKDNYSLLEADSQLLKQKIDEIGWEQIRAAETEDDISHDQRILNNKTALRLWRLNPIIGHVVSLSNWFVFGQGINIPKVDDDECQEIVNNIWTDEYNKKSVFSPMAQWTRHTILQLTGELFFVFFPPKPGNNTPLQIRTIHPNSISDIITCPDDKDIDIAYKRRLSGRKYDYSSDSWREDMHFTIKYHLDWALNPGAEGIIDNLPPEEKTLEGKIYHIKINTIGKRGWSEIYRVVRWVDSFNKLASARVSYARAEALFAWERKTKRGKADISSAKERFSPSGKASQVPPAVGSTLFTTEGVEWKRLPQTGVGAHSAAEDLRQLRLQIATGLSVPEHYLADGSQGNMATAKTMEIWALKKYLALQKMWEEIYVNIVKYGLKVAGIKKKYSIDIDFPPITVQEVKSWIDSVVLSSEKGFISEELASILIMQVLGINNISDEIKKLYRSGEKKESAKDVLEGLVSQVEKVIKEEGNK